MTTSPPPPPASNYDGAPGESEIDIQYWSGLLWRRKTLIVACALVGTLLGLVVALVQTPEYEAGVMLEIEPPTPTFMTVTDALTWGGGYWQNTDFYNTQFKVLRSKGLAEKVVSRLKLTDYEPFKSSPDPGNIFISHIGVSPIPESRLVTVTVTHPDPNEAALWANTLADVYIAYSVQRRVDAARSAADWVSDQLDETQQQMQEAQAQLFQSYQSQDLFVPEGSVSAVSTSIAKLNEDYVRAQARRIEIEAALKQAREMSARGEPLDVLPQVASDPAVMQFNTQIAAVDVELGRLGEKFKEGHPEVQKVMAQRGQLSKAKANRAQQILEALDAEHAQLTKREGELRGAIDSQKAQAASQSRKVTELDALRERAESAKGLYEVLLQKLNESDIAESMRTNTVAIVDRASVPQYPVRPKKRRAAMAGLLLGFVAGFGLVFARELLANTTFRDDQQIERFLHLPVLATVPKHTSEERFATREAYRQLRTALIFARRHERGQVVLVTGTIPKEGKTTTTVELARVMADAGKHEDEKTLVIDCDLRRAQIHERLGIPREPGFTDAFRRRLPAETLIQRTNRDCLFALTAGPLPPNPPALLGQKTFAQVLDTLRDHYDWILIDSPPVASVTDALLVARQADHTVLVVREGPQTLSWLSGWIPWLASKPEQKGADKRHVKRSVSALKKVTGQLLGVVFNMVDVKARGYGYYGYGYYTQRDGEDATAGEHRAKTAVKA